MSFFKKLFGGESIDDSMNSTVELMDQMADESERVHRNMVQLYNKEVKSGMLNGAKAEASWKGIFKARFLATMFPMYMFNNKWRQQNEQKVMEMLNVASGVAISSLHDSGAEYDRNEAEKLVMPIMKNTLSAIKNEFTSGPSKPSESYYTEGFQKLEEVAHDALSDSIGEDNYSQEVRERFKMPLKSGVMSSLRATVEEFGSPY